MSALEKSIKHWEENLFAARRGGISSVRVDADACALCGEFRTSSPVPSDNDEGYEYRYSCGECPVRQATGRDLCDGTPYDDVVAALDKYSEAPSDLHRVVIRQVVEAVEAELEFLKGLRPKADK